MFPYKDENPTVLTPVVTVAIIALNAASWIFVQGLGSAGPLVRSVCDLGLIPGELLGTVSPGTGVALAPGLVCAVDPQPQYWTVLTSMFLHGGWLHLIGNMVFLWVFGNNIEDAMGHGRFVAFYLLAGVAAAGAQVAVSPTSAVPMVGASGAISGVMGAYLLLYPHARVYMLVPLGFFVTTLATPAYIMLGYWILLQLLGGLPSIGVERGGTAFFAHIGGFVAGLVLIKLFETAEHRARRRAAGPVGRSGPSVRR
jgi:membrane associated rhomboid family serine protease